MLFLGRVFRQDVGLGVDVPMLEPPFHGVGGIRPFRVDPHEVGQARAVDEFVDHTHRHQRGVRGEFGKGEREFALVGHGFSGEVRGGYCDTTAMP